MDKARDGAREPFVLTNLKEILKNHGALEDAQINDSHSNGLGEICAVMPSDVDDLIKIFTEGTDFGDEEEKEAYALDVRAKFISADAWLTREEDEYDLEPWYGSADWHEVAGQK
ncbi:hypothetical protein [Deinococcus marmoris]|uniref:hypothetical protein n=1 Tax=Deinococcus marmoris TaxID=249408 RepID=UPI00111545F5|nr:hypothetical protein [Deinococcus marmoris]